MYTDTEAYKPLNKFFFWLFDDCSFDEESSGRASSASNFFWNLSSTPTVDQMSQASIIRVVGLQDIFSLLADVL